MAKTKPLLRRAPSDDEIEIEVEGHMVAATRGEPVAASLLAAGILDTSRSAKFRRPRGPYCLDGDCGTCLVRIDGRPNQRSCMRTAARGMQVESQNTVGPKGLDPTQLVDMVFRKGLDHHHLMVKPRLVNQLMQGVARELTGFGDLPSGMDTAAVRHEHRKPDVLIIGAGSAGRAAAERLGRARVDALLVDRHDAKTLAADPFSAHTPLLPSAFMARAAVFGAYPGESLFAAARDEADGTRVLVTFQARHVLLAMGTREPLLTLANNDLPGVVGARGLLRMLTRTGSRLQTSVVVIGDADHGERCRKALDDLRADGAPPVERLPVDEVDGLVGRQRVEGVEARGRKLRASLVALAPPPSPVHELAAQAGARMSWDGEGYVPVRDGDGSIGQLGLTRLWACGNMCGYVGSRGAQSDAERVAANIVGALQGASDG